ncbi:hypothetical protein BC937DRAFT_93332 [Endogone sp. FLAS-F59071]|nr:hypothetical protein BC937DRAFT_93332 [Endogone sp. FLAS-F59071]|eukprot:RUS14791.1 hypothetical protein BC937DRAFT_93332 [Endogone sp. FLAS-F59071]
MKQCETIPSPRETPTAPQNTQGFKPSTFLSAPVTLHPPFQDIMLLDENICQSQVSHQATPPRDISHPGYQGPQVWSEVSIKLARDANTNIKTRQELCEGTPYFRAYHGGVYSNNGVAFGFLIDGWGSMRDQFTGRTFISHGGGRSTSSKKQKTSHYRLSSSQNSSDTSISALLNSYHDMKPIVVIIGSRYKKATFEIPHRYCVLGWYGITHAWAEIEEQSDNDDEELTDEEELVNGNTQSGKKSKQESSMRQKPAPYPPRAYAMRGKFVRWKFRFEWIENQEFTPWWESKAEPDGTFWFWIYGEICERCGLVSIVANQCYNEQMSEPGSLVLPKSPFVYRRKVAEHKCEVCKKKSPIIYKEGWSCLNDTCDRFWKVLPAGAIIHQDLPRELHISDEFLAPGLLIQELRQWSIPFSIVPRPPPDTTMITHDIGRLFWKGSHCRCCGRISCREQWQGWQCRNCRALRNTPHLVIPAAILRDPNRPIYDGPTLDEGPLYLSMNSGIVKAREVLAEGVVKAIYCFPEGGVLIHLISPQNCKKDADELFELYQTQEKSPEHNIVGFRRHPLVNSKRMYSLWHFVNSRLLANQFSFNAGAPYKHSVRVETAPLDDAPFAVRRALQLMHDASRVIVPDYEFNEVLSIAYMEGQKMSWHDDGEKDVDDIVVSLSMGSDAEMWFRRKRGPGASTVPITFPKRPRGRPPKIVKLDADNTASSAPPVQIAEARDEFNKCRFEFIQCVSPTSAASIHEIASSSTCSPPPLPPTPVTAIPLLPKRGRGRPRKNKYTAVIKTKPILPTIVTSRTIRKASAFEKQRESLVGSSSSREPASESKSEPSASLIPFQKVFTDVVENQPESLASSSSSQVTISKKRPMDPSEPVTIDRGPDRAAAPEPSNLHRIVLKLRLSHGDILIMRGREIQKYYEHAAFPNGFRIVATARRIITNDTS